MANRGFGGRWKRGLALAKNREDGRQEMLLSHHRSFRPNWIWRGVVEVDVITPAVGEAAEVADVYTIVFGVLKFV
jgi:hypothetical protein